MQNPKDTDSSEPVKSPATKSNTASRSDVSSALNSGTNRQSSHILGPVLGIETSCDETGIAIFHPEQGIVSEALYSQVELHAQYGGVVPELASRDHVRKLLPLTRQVLADAQLQPTDLAAVAYTSGPGLMGALLSGAAFARSFALTLNMPAIGVHHMEGHLLAPMLEKPDLAMPFTALLVSGGHTLLVNAGALGDYTILGESVDDAAGEAFDKTAKLLGLPYPGGPHLAKLATDGDPTRFRFPRPMTDRPGFDFSFSGLKTAVLTQVNKLGDALEDLQTRADLARGFEEAAVDTLVIKCRRALEHTKHSNLVIAGGVSANTRLRERLEQACRELGAQVHYAALNRCTDNGAMIAYAGYQRLRRGERSGLAIDTKPRWPINELTPLAS